MTIVCSLAAYAALQIAVNVTADVVYPALREPEYGRKLALLKRQLNQDPDRPLLLLLGSSRTAYGIRPESLFGVEADAPRVYNFGILGGGPVFELMYFERLLAEGVTPRWVVVEVHPAMLKMAPELIAAQIPPIERCDGRDLRLLKDYLIDPAAWQNWLHYRSAACYQFRAELVRRVAPGWLPPPTVPDTNSLDKTTSCGWVPGPWPKPDEALRTLRCNLVRQAYAPAYRQFEVSDHSNRALRQILNRCRDKGIATALLLMPEADELRDAEVVAADEKIAEYLSELGREFNARMIDVSHWCEGADFADGQHLLAAAAERLSQRLGQTVFRDWLEAPNGATPVASVAAGGRRLQSARR